MNRKNVEVLQYTAAAFVLVLVSGLLASIFAPDNEIGHLIKFGLPLMTGIGTGIWIHYRFRDILDVNIEESD